MPRLQGLWDDPQSCVMYIKCMKYNKFLISDITLPLETSVCWEPQQRLLAQGFSSVPMPGGRRDVENSDVQDTLAKGSDTRIWMFLRDF